MMGLNDYSGEQPVMESNGKEFSDIKVDQGEFFIYLGTKQSFLSFCH